jgi:hypothetical protein
VSLSTLESEYVALSDAVRGGCSTQYVLDELLTTSPVKQRLQRQPGRHLQRARTTRQSHTADVVVLKGRGRGEGGEQGNAQSAYTTQLELQRLLKTERALPVKFGVRGLASASSASPHP